ncbi:MAG: thiosulfate oxidation carrier protein SoxY [Pseudomonadota bacterium]
MTDSVPTQLTRRSVIGASAGAVFVAATPLAAFATPEEMQAAIRDVFGDRPLQEGRVTLTLPPIAENGYSVPLDVSVESPMTADDFVQRIAVFSPLNPVASLIRFDLGPRAGRASVSTRIRLAGTQTVLAVAETNTGALWTGAAKTVVTLAACIVL